MAHYSYTVSLRIFHPDMDPEGITKILSRVPKRMCKAGEQRKTPKGNLLDGVYKNSYWYTELVPEGERSSSDDNLEDFLFEIIKEIEPQSQFFNKIRSEDGRVELFIGTFGNRNYGYELTPKLLAALAGLGISLSFDVYPGI